MRRSKFLVAGGIIALAVVGVLVAQANGVKPPWYDPVTLDEKYRSDHECSPNFGFGLDGESTVLWGDLPENVRFVALEENVEKLLQRQTNHAVRVTDDIRTVWQPLIEYMQGSNATDYSPQDLFLDYQGQTVALRLRWAC